MINTFSLTTPKPHTTRLDLSDIKQFAINAISRIIVSENLCTSHGTFAYNGPCYKLTQKLPRAATTYHEKVHGKESPCGGEYRTYTFKHTTGLRFLPGIKLSRTFRFTATSLNTMYMSYERLPMFFLSRKSCGKNGLKVDGKVPNYCGSGVSFGPAPGTRGWYILQRKIGRSKW
jgi:hypothetical protein